jgi:hypothetical protein
VLLGAPAQAQPCPAIETVVLYKAGAGGALMWTTMNTLPGDGVTVVVVNLPHTVLQPMEGNVQYKTEDITPVYWFHYTPDALVVPEQCPIKTTYVPYKGTGDLATAVLGAQVAGTMSCSAFAIDNKVRVRAQAVAMDRRHPFPGPPCPRCLGLRPAGGRHEAETLDPPCAGRPPEGVSAGALEAVPPSRYAMDREGGGGGGGGLRRQPH